MDGKQTPSEEPTWQFKPGETISPRAQAPAQPLPSASPAPAPTEQATQPAPQASAPQPAVKEAAQPIPVDATEASNQGSEDYSDFSEGLTWTASEFIAHDKTAGWHIGLIGVAVLAAVILWLITRDFVTSVVVIVAGGVLSLYGGRRPSELQYRLDNYGLSIGQKQFSFADFKAFSVVPEGAFASIALLPTKRFAPMTTLYFDPADADKILDILGSHLPARPMKADVIDSLMRRIRF